MSATDNVTLKLLLQSLRANYEELKTDYSLLASRFTRLETERDTAMKQAEYLSKHLAKSDQRCRVLAKELEELRRSISGGHSKL